MRSNDGEDDKLLCRSISRGAERDIIPTNHPLPSTGPKGKGLILRNHGLLTVGSTVDEACYLYTLMERSCEVQLLAEAAAANGVPKVYVPEESAKYTFEMASDPESLYWEAQPDMEYEAFLCNEAHKD